MDPFTLLVAGVLGAAMASSTSDDGPGEWEDKRSLWDLFGWTTWHFARSWDWDPFVSTVRAGDLASAEDLVDQETREEGNDPEDPKYRTYAIVRGGTEVYEAEHPSQELLLPAGTRVQVVWQAERSIDGIEVVLPGPMRVSEAIDLAWDKVPQSSDCWTYASESAEEEGIVKPFSPELVVVGGEFVYIGRL